MESRRNFVAALAALALAACGGSGDPGGSPVPFTVIDSSSSAIATQRFVTVRDNAAWTALWAEHMSGRTPQPAPPAVDFSRTMVVGVFLGDRPNACYGVAIQSILHHGNRLTVQYSELTPPVGAVCAQVITRPAQLATLERSDLPVEFMRLN